MPNGHFLVPAAENEPIQSYAVGSHERASLKARLDQLLATEIEIPIRIGGERITTGSLGECRMPHAHAHRLGQYHKASSEHVAAAVDAARSAHASWSRMPWEARAAVFLKAADLLAGPHRDLINAATMLSQSKNVYQAEIDAACELIDFWRFNAAYMQELYAEQPESAPGMWNYVEHRPLEGFVFAVTPFNFTSIAGNLPTAPALMGNTVLWKPASSAVYSAHFLMELLEEAGLPAGVINFLPGSGGDVGNPAVDNPELAGIHFTGSTEVFHGMWERVGKNIKKYKSYPRIVGETGGKDFIFAHASADVAALITAGLRGAFEYQGQKCSAASRMYVPASIWEEFRDGLLAEVNKIEMGPPTDFRNFMCAVIDKGAFESIKGYIDFARESSDAEILAGGECDDSTGWFIQPTVIEAKTPHFKTLCEEIFGPVLTLYRYEDAALEETLDLCDSATAYALTGAIFAKDREAIVHMSDRLKNAAGNFYINDKPTGAVVGQQPFGGSRASGTNDKAGSALNLVRWMSPRTIKENFAPPRSYAYPFMDEE
ncbi:MAG TPA: L-glutamate gamma-semialdehyde dehydrogenase [Candidatus Krumholzibacteria bacterium]